MITDIFNLLMWSILVLVEVVTMEIITFQNHKEVSHADEHYHILVKV